MYSVDHFITCNPLRIVSVHSLRFKGQAVASTMAEAPELRDYLLSDVTETGEVLWADGWASTMMVIFNGAECVGKRPHAVLISEGDERFRKKFIDECHFVKNLRHPNIVQFLGIYFLPSSDLPTLVTELLPYNLDDLLEARSNIPLPVKLSILHDTARGLLYLHSQVPPIVHRDLTATNLRLNSALTAKITNFRTARSIYETQQDGERLSQCPGSSVYMPPEACTSDIAPDYSSKLDIFSFGVVVLFTVTNCFPGDLLPATYWDENGKLYGRTEVERRYQYMHKAEQV